MKKSNSIQYIVALLVIILVGIVIKTHHSSPASPVVSDTTAGSTATQLPGLQTGKTPWVAELINLHKRLDAIGLPALSQEGTLLHTHQHLDIYINGTAVPVSSGIGINEQEHFISPIHVHDNTGIIHVESPTIQKFTLGQFFDIWGVQFNQNCIGGYCADATQSLKIYVDGKIYQGDLREIELTPHEVLAIVYGTPTQTPQQIRSTYTFPAGY
jgi:hypothetical protein